MKKKENNPEKKTITLTTSLSQRVHMIRKFAFSIQKESHQVNQGQTKLIEKDKFKASNMIAKTDSKITVNSKRTACFSAFKYSYRLASMRHCILLYFYMAFAV